MAGKTQQLKQIHYVFVIIIYKKWSNNKLIFKIIQRRNNN